MDIREEWNEIAFDRLTDRLNGNDTSYNEVLLPTIINNIKKNTNLTSNILDFGCGTGELTYEIAKLNLTVTGIDISNYSIKLAKEYFNHSQLNFINCSLLDINFNNHFDLVVANMSLMDTENLNENLNKIYKILKVNGKILITITHPSYWPIYWDYINDVNFDYSKECKITKTYRTKNKVFAGFETSHFHRPFNHYINMFVNLKFKILSCQELKNPNDNIWYPRFLYFELQK